MVVSGTMHAQMSKQKRKKEERKKIEKKETDYFIDSYGPSSRVHQSCLFVFRPAKFLRQSLGFVRARATSLHTTLQTLSKS